MRRRYSLRFGIILALVAFVSASSGLFALGVYYVNARTEESLFDDILDQEYEEFLQAFAERQDQALPRASHMRSYLIDAGAQHELPAPLAKLGPGQHHDVVIDGRYFHVLHRRMGDRHVYIALDIHKHTLREQRLGIFLLSGFVLASLIAVWVGYLLSRRLIAPVTELAERVSQLEPGQTGRPIAADFAGVEVEVIAQAFDHFLQRLDRFIEREHAFTEDASHELRTPLAVINTAAELALADAHAPDSVRRPLQRIRRAGQQMTRLSNALLFLARESEHRVEDSEFCQVEAVVGDVLNAYRPGAGSPVELRHGVLEPIRLSVPAEFIEIVAANLVQNALANTERGYVRVTLAHGVLTVEDTGRGIPAEDLPHIFDRYFRGAQSRGIGRGLDLVQRICSREGWRIEVDSQLGKGSRFTVWFSGDSGQGSR